MADFFKWQGDVLCLNVKVQPRASKDEIAEILGESIKIRITAAPVDGEANKHLVAYLAKLFKVSKSQVSIVSGETGRDKRIRIECPKQWPPIFNRP